MLINLFFIRQKIPNDFLKVTEARQLDTYIKHINGTTEVFIKYTKLIETKQKNIGKITFTRKKRSSLRQNFYQQNQLYVFCTEESFNNQQSLNLNSSQTLQNSAVFLTMERRPHNRNQNQQFNRFRLYDDHDNDGYREENREENESASNNSSDSDESVAEVWVFGYGSLCWYPGFEFSKCVTGYVRGYVRRFWQGNTTHRGTKDKPGRVVTLVEQSDGITWGCAYKISGSTALGYLKQRECTLGGYTTLFTKFYPRVAADDMELCGEAFPALLYIATEKNTLWMGETPLSIIAQEIVDSRGPSGHNVEYLIRLANFMRDELKGVIVDDEHLFQLEQRVRDILTERKICVHSLMGRQPERIRRDSHEEIRRPTTFEFSSRVPDKKLRCLNI